MQSHVAVCALTTVLSSVLLSSLFALQISIMQLDLCSSRIAPYCMLHQQSHVHPAPGIAPANAADQRQLGLQCQQHTFRLSNERHSLASFSD